MSTAQSRSRIADMGREIAALRSENEALRSENEELRETLAFHENHPSISAGIHGERFIARSVGGVRSRGNGPYDVSVEAGNVRFEVKLSHLNSAAKDRRTPTLRWTWARVLGNSGGNVYDRLILLGEKDKRYSASYGDQTCPYVIFDVPYSDVAPLTTSAGRYRNIQLSTNPNVTRPDSARSRALFSKYQVTIEELKKRYPGLNDPMRLLSQFEQESDRTE